MLCDEADNIKVGDILVYKNVIPSVHTGIWSDGSVIKRLNTKGWEGNNYELISGSQLLETDDLDSVIPRSLCPADLTNLFGKVCI